MSLNILEKVDYLVKKHLIYKTEKVDNWNSYKKEILSSEELKKTARISADCDDFAMTAIDLAVHFGVKIENLARVICWAHPYNDSRKEGHMVAMYREGNKYYFFGDTMGPICDINNRDHEITMINWLSDNKDWIIKDA
jgi:hypothetical protein